MLYGSHFHKPDESIPTLTQKTITVTSKQELVQMIERYIRYYNTRRVQRNLGVMTPFEKHRLSLAA